MVVVLDMRGRFEMMAFRDAEHEFVVEKHNYSNIEWIDHEYIFFYSFEFMMQIEVMMIIQKYINNKLHVCVRTIQCHIPRLD